MARVNCGPAADVPGSGQFVGGDPAVQAWAPAGFFDAAAGLPPSPACLQWLSAGWPTTWADPVGRHPAAARSRAVLEESRRRFAAYLNCAPAEVWFAPNTDVALATAVTAVAGRTELPVLVSAIERLAVLEAVEVLPNQAQVLAVTARARVLLPVPVPPAGAVVVQAANRELGAVQDLAAVRVAASPAPLIVDASVVRAAADLPADWDVIVLEPASWGGPSGLAVVGCRTGTPWHATPPAKPGDRFPGRAPVALIAAAAMSLPDSETAAAEELRIGVLADHFAHQVLCTIPDVALLSGPHRVAHIVSLSLLYVNAEQMVDDLAARGYSVHSGSACVSDLKRPSHVLSAVGALTHGNLRVSLPPGCPSAEVDGLVRQLAELVGQQRREAGL